MKNAILGLLVMVSAQAFGAVDLQTHNIELAPEIKTYLAKKLEKCTLGLPGETFKVTNVAVRADRVDNGITDHYYTIDIAYEAERNDVIYNTLKVQVLDADFDNYREYEERLSFEVQFDSNNFCK